MEKGRKGVSEPWGGGQGAALDGAGRSLRDAPGTRGGRARRAGGAGKGGFEGGVQATSPAGRALRLGKRF